MITAIGLTAAMPSIVYPLIKSGLDPELIAWWTHHHLLFMAGVFAGTFVLYELLSVIDFVRVLHKHDPRHPTIHVVRQLAIKGMLRHTPGVIEMANKQTNVLACTSLLCGHYIVFIGNAINLMNEREREVVIAHEIAHLKHADLIGHLIFSTATSVAYGYVILFYCVGFFGTVLGVLNPAQAIPFYVAALLMLFARVGILILSLAYWRTREYLADAAAIAFTSWDHRRDHIALLEKLTNHNDVKDWFAYFWPEWLRNHPRIKNRAKALGIDFTHME